MTLGPRTRFDAFFKDFNFLDFPRENLNMTIVVVSFLGKLQNENSIVLKALRKKVNFNHRKNGNKF
jgi:hypothetical protein